MSLGHWYNTEMLTGRFTLHGVSATGENCKLWLGGEALGEAHFYLETGFYGDDGGNVQIFEGNYHVEGKTVILEISETRFREWDDSIGFEKNGKKHEKKCIIAKLSAKKSIKTIQIHICGKKYLLKLDEKY